MADLSGAGPMTSILNFYSELFGGCDAGSIEMRAFSGRLRRRSFFATNDLAAAVRFIEEHQGLNCFHGVATRDGRGGATENLLLLPAVWVDIDFKETPRAEAWRRAQRFAFKPSVWMASGGGTHGYFILEEPARVSEAEKISRVLHGLAEHFGGDHNATDLARILRAPGSLNHKYTPARPAAVVESNSFRYALDDLLDVCPAWTPPQTTEGSSKPSGWLLDALRGVEAGKRDATGAKIAGYFLNRLPSTDVQAILTAWNCHNQPPLPDEELQRIFSSISRYKVKNHGTPKKRFKILTH